MSRGYRGLTLQRQRIGPQPEQVPDLLQVVLRGLLDPRLRAPSSAPRSARTCFSTATTTRRVRRAATSAHDVPQPPAPAGCAAPSACAGWCARRASPPSASSIPCSSPPARACAGRSAPCPAASISRPMRRRGRRARWRASASAGVLLFGLPEAKDAEGSEGYAEDGVVQQAVRAISAACRDLLVDDRRLPLRVHLARPLRASARQGDGRAATTPPSTCSRGWPSRTRGPAPTSSRPPT